MRPLPEGWSTEMSKTQKQNTPYYVKEGRRQWDFPARQASFDGPKRQGGGDFGDGVEP